MSISLTNIANIDTTAGAPLDGVREMTSVNLGGTTYLYVSVLGSDAITVFRLESDGTPVHVETVYDDATTHLTGTSTLTSYEIGGETYVIASSDSTEFGVTVFRVEANGTLSYSDELSGVDLISDFAVVEIGDEIYLFGSDGSADGIRRYGLGSDGTLSQQELTLDSADAAYQLDGVTALTTAEVGGLHYLVAAGVIDDGLSVFRVSADGLLSTGGSLTNTDNVEDTDNANYLLDGVSDLASARVGDQTYIYAASATEDGITTFRLNAGGVLEYVNRLIDNGNMTLNNVSSIQVTEVGGASYLTAVSSAEDGLTVYRVNQSGALAKVGEFLDDTDTHLGTFAIDSHIAEVDGIAYLYTGDAEGLSAFRLDMPFSLSWNGSTYATSELLANAVAMAEAGSTITLNDVALYPGFSEFVEVRRNDITVELGPTVLTESPLFGANVPVFDLDGFAWEFTVTGATGVVVRGSSANGETIRTGKGGDVIRSQAGDDLIVSGGGVDTLRAGHGNDTIRAGGGDDNLRSGAGSDLVICGGGHDYIVDNGGGSDTISGGGGVDFIEAGTGADVLRGGKGADDIRGEEGADLVLGQAGNDTLTGDEGRDTVSGGDGNDEIFGGDGHDDLSGGGGGDYLSGGNGDDTITGDGGAETIYGGADDDLIDGGTQSDTISGGSGNDTLTGGGGADTFVFAIGDGNDRVTDFRDDIDGLDFDLAGLGYADGAALIAGVGGFTNGQGHAVLDFGGDRVVIENTDVSLLADDIF